MEKARDGKEWKEREGKGRDGVIEDWPRPRGQNFVALAMLFSNTFLGNGEGGGRMEIRVKFVSLAVWGVDARVWL